MLKSIRQFFESKIDTGERDQGAQGEHALQLATAALLIEVTRADFEVTADERAAVDGALREVFELSEEETRELVALAEDEVDSSSSLFQFTNLIDKQFPLKQKIAVVEMLWRVAYSDSYKDKYEESLVRKIADLLHVPHSAFVATRYKVEQAHRKH